jgi:ABC-type nickel/cobalt efflux system permease component RcnA
LEQRSKYGSPGAFALSALTLSACSGPAVWGNLAVFAVSVGIFVSTLALGHGR